MSVGHFRSRDEGSVRERQCGSLKHTNTHALADDIFLSADLPRANYSIGQYVRTRCMNVGK
jgi:hypothetical protein